jgi:hypothetical protein
MPLAWPWAVSAYAKKENRERIKVRMEITDSWIFQQNLKEGSVIIKR